MTIEYNDCEACPCLAMPLLRRWSVRRHFTTTLRRCIAGGTCGRGRSARHFVANEDQAGSNPVVRTSSTSSRELFQRSKTVLRSAVNRGGVGSSPAAGAVRAKPTGEASAFQAVPGEFDSRRPLDARAVQWLNAGLTCRRSLVRSQPRAPGRVLPGWPRNPGFQSGNTGSIPVHDASRDDSVV